MSKVDYWVECIAVSAESNDIHLTTEQIDALAEDVAAGHSMFSECSGDPGWGDRVRDIEDSYKRRIRELETQLAEAHGRGEAAAKRILGIHPDDRVAIDKYGFVEVLP